MSENKPIYIDVAPVPGLVENARVYGLYDSVRRAKFPMAVDVDQLTSDLSPGIASLAWSAAGSGHDQWLTGVIVQFDLTFSNKAWVEMERYHFIDFVSSQSTMHRITKFDLDTAYNEYVDPRIVEIMAEKVKEYNDLSDSLRFDLTPQSVTWRQDMQKKQDELYLGILYSNPAGFKLTAGMTTNYRQLKTIYRQRKDHRLPEWREFCKWMHDLPKGELITREESNGGAI